MAFLRRRQRERGRGRSDLWRRLKALAGQTVPSVLRPSAPSLNSTSGLRCQHREAARRGGSTCGGVASLCCCKCASDQAPVVGQCQTMRQSPPGGVGCWCPSYLICLRHWRSSSLKRIPLVSWVMMRSSTAQTRVRQLVSPGTGPSPGPPFDLAEGALEQVRRPPASPVAG
jgi:hypothetical protein